MDVKRFFHNCLEVRETPEGLLPIRFTPGQMQYYQQLNEMSGIRAKCTAGVALSFVTSQRRLAFHFKAAQFCRNWITFDLWENGQFTQSVRFDGAVARGEVAFVRETKGEKTITIYLPYSCEVRLSGFDFGDARPVEDARPVLWTIGDSITQGMESEYPSFTYAVSLARQMGYRLLNQGVGGRGFADSCLDADPGVEPAVITVGYGTNDIEAAAQDWEGFAARMNRLLVNLRQRWTEAPVYCLSPFWRSDLETQQRQAVFEKIGEEIQRQAEKTGCRFVEGMDLIAHQPEFFGDRYLHPNALGFTQCALGLAGQMTSPK